MLGAGRTLSHQCLTLLDMISLKEIGNCSISRFDVGSRR